MDFMPRFAAGAIFADDPGGDPPAVFVGSCGAYTRRDAFVTAAHCVPTDRELLIVLEGESARVVRQHVIHPTADLALLFTEPPPPDAQWLSRQVYQRPENLILDGADFICHGYPAEGSPANMPVGRTIRGNIQRMIIGYVDKYGRRYMAFEMSCPAPRGLSGSVLAYTSRGEAAIAVVTSNLDSYATIDSTEEIEENGNIYRNEVRRVISYGLAACLTDKLDWLDEHMAGLPAADT